MNTELCSACTCHLQQTCLVGVHPLVGDGYCHDELNNLDCDYDGGDCCGSCILLEYCTECACYGNISANGIQNSLVGDGYCNDDTNDANCNYDGGDCCVNVNTDYCSECSCLASGVITSPGFPGNYGNNLDLTWLIQAPLGQFIQLNFLNFELESW